MPARVRFSSGLVMLLAVRSRPVHHAVVHASLPPPSFRSLPTAARPLPHDPSRRAQGPLCFSGTRASELPYVRYPSNCPPLPPRLVPALRAEMRQR